MDKKIIEIAKQAFSPLDVGDSLNSDGILMKCAVNLAELIKASMQLKSEPVGYLLTENGVTEYLPKETIVVSHEEATKLATPVYTEAPLNKPVVDERLSEDKLQDLITEYHPKCARGAKRFEVTDWWNFGIAVQKALLTQLTINTETINQDNGDLVNDLRMYANNSGYSHLDYSDTMKHAADVIESQLSTSSDNDAIDSNKWKEINTANFSDDDIWLYDGVDSIEGPRPLETDDYDKYTYWAPVQHPSTRFIDTSRKP